VCVCVCVFLWGQGHKARTQKLAARMLKIAMQLIEKHKSKESGANVDADKLNLVDILLSQQGDDKLPDHAMAAILFVSPQHFSNPQSCLNT
jgi:hypothetical protein